MSGVVTATILNKRTEMDPKYNLMSIDIIREVNKIPIAQMVLLDGDAANQKFKISNTDFFKPGEEIEIKLRYEGENQLPEATVFKGIIVKHTIQADQHGSLLTIDLKDKAIKLTTQRKSAVFRKKTDATIIKEIINGSDLSITSITATKPEHQEMVQYYCTDWDFILSRADVNGYWVLVNDGEITVEKPNLSNRPPNTFQYGISDIYEFKMSADIRSQHESVESMSWDIKTQDMSASQKAKDVFFTQGNLKGKDLAKTIASDNYKLINSGQLNEQEMQVLADAKLQKSRFSMLKGRIKVPGFAQVKLGEAMAFEGIGDRFNGKNLVTGIRHQVTQNGWQTDLQFGLSAN